jgi:uncharacterized protein
MFQPNKSHNDYSTWITKHFGCRVQKISLDADFTCPNRDNTKGTGGCIYCDNTTFKPDYCSPEKSIAQQLEEGIAFFSKKYPAQKYIAYFQAYSNTYDAIVKLEKLYDEALSCANVVGLSVATRPDCINDDILKLLHKLSKKHYVSIEFGIESTNNNTLKFINRCHTFEDSVKAINEANHWELPVCGHMILGLPGEDHNQIITHAQILSQLPIHTLKLHQLQIIKGTKLAELYFADNSIIHSYSVDQYIDLVIDFLENLKPEIIIERFTSESPLNKVIAPNWGGIKNFEIVEKIRKRMIERNSWQGKHYIQHHA